jgi:hypothetical protein
MARIQQPKLLELEASQHVESRFLLLTTFVALTDWLTSRLGNDIVTLKVGENEDEFVVHKKLLCSRIPYFDKMFQDPWQESVASIATFPEDTPESFDLLITWLYTNTIRYNFAKYPYDW